MQDESWIRTDPQLHEEWLTAQQAHLLMRNGFSLLEAADAVGIAEEDLDEWIALFDSSAQGFREGGS